MTNKCKCGRFVSATEGVKCKKCTSMFHRVCINTSPTDSIPGKWVCEPCRKHKASSIKVSPTPAVDMAPVVPAVGPVVPIAANGSTQDSFSNSVITELRLLRSEMALFRGEIAQLNITLAEFNSRVDNIEARLSRLEEQQSVSQELSEDGSVKNIISQLQFQLNDRDQDLLMNDVQVSGLHESPRENLISITCLLAKKLGVEIDDRDVVSAERLGPRRAASTSADNGVPAQSRPRPVVVRLARRALRDNLLRSARVRRGADSSGIIDGEPRRFYVNEHLTRTNRHLFYKAREEGRSKNWKFIWTKGGRIYIRQTATASVLRVRSEADIVKYFANTSFLRL